MIVVWLFAALWIALLVCAVLWWIPIIMGMWRVCRCPYCRRVLTREVHRARHCPICDGRW